MPRTPTSVSEEVAELAPVKVRESHYKSVYREISPNGSVPGSWNPEDFDGYVSSFIERGWRVASSQALGVRFDVDSKAPILSVFVTLVKE